MEGVSVLMCVARAQAPTSYHILLYTLSFGLGDTGRCWMVVWCVMCPRANTHRVHLPTLGLDGQVYVCMCMGKYSV